MLGFHKIFNKPLLAARYLVKSSFKLPVSYCELLTKYLSAVPDKTSSTTMNGGCYESLLKSTALCRLMLPDDANVAGNVHGGTILKMIEEAGMIITTRYCNTAGKQNDAAFQPAVSALVRVEKTDFRQPMFIGEVAELVAEVTYTSEHSLEVQVVVWAENVIKGAKRLTNKATLWYVPLSVEKPHAPVEVPPMQYAGEEDQIEGRKRYDKQKLDRAQGARKKVPRSNRRPSFCEEGVDRHSVEYSQSVLIHPVGVQDCNDSGYCRGGVIMKLMDECAGIVAAKHCGTNVVTASMDTTDFHETVEKASLITLTGYITFTSSRSMEVEVLADVEKLVSGEITKFRAVSALFTYVSLNNAHQVIQVPQVKLSSEEEYERFAEGQKHYEERKQQRQASKDNLAKTSSSSNDEDPSISSKGKRSSSSQSGESSKSSRL